MLYDLWTQRHEVMSDITSSLEKNGELFRPFNAFPVDLTGIVYVSSICSTDQPTRYWYYLHFRRVNSSLRACPCYLDIFNSWNQTSVSELMFGLEIVPGTMTSNWPLNTFIFACDCLCLCVTETSSHPWEWRDGVKTTAHCCSCTAHRGSSHSGVTVISQTWKTHPR